MNNSSTSKLTPEARQALPTGDELEQGFDAMRNDQSGSVVEFKSLASIQSDNAEPSGKFIEFKSLPEQKTLAEYAQKKGIPCVFRGMNDQLVRGILVEWDDDDFFRVIGMEGERFVTQLYRASELYEMPENSTLRGAVEFCRTHEDEVADSRSQVGSMLKTIGEQEQKKAA